jgi:hypothetical protein
MHALIQTDAEIGAVLMKALIYRRIELVAQGIGDALLIGSAQPAATLRIKAFLTRNDHPFKHLPEVARISNLVSFEPDEVQVFLDDKRLALEPGQSVTPHGIDRGLDPDEILKRGEI